MKKEAIAAEEIYLGWLSGSSSSQAHLFNLIIMQRRSLKSFMKVVEVLHEGLSLDEKRFSAKEYKGIV